MRQSHTRRLKFETDEAVIRDFNIPGAAVATIHKKQITQSYLGRIDKKGGLVNNSTIFQVGSISKSLTAWGVMKLVEEKILKLDVPISRYLPLVSINNYSDKMTLRTLLSHTSGLPALFYMGQVRNSYKNTDRHKFNNASVLNEPGDRFEYTGLGYFLIQQMVEYVLETPFANVMDELILKPLNMNYSSFEWLETNEQLSRPHNYFGREIKHLYYYESAAAGFYSTVPDMVRFVQANLGESQSVLSEESVKLMHTRFRREIPYGLGFQIGTIEGQRVVWHTGRNRGWSSAMIFIPERNSGVISLTNSDTGGSFNAWIAEKFALEQGFPKDKFRHLVGLGYLKGIQVLKQDVQLLLKQWFKKYK